MIEIPNWAAVERLPSGQFAPNCINPLRGTGLVTKVCPTCGNEFEDYGWKHKTYCSHRCACSSPEFSQRMSKAHKGKPAWNKGQKKQLYHCFNCGKFVWKWESEVRETVFCNKRCFYDFLSKTRKKEMNPNWKNGASFEPYCPRFNDSLRESIRNEYNRCCAICGKGELFNGRKLSVHHIDGNKMQGCSGTKWLLVPLCRICHRKTESKTEGIHYMTLGTLKTLEVHSLA